MNVNGKLILCMLIFTVLSSSLVSAGFLDWFSGITGMASIGIIDPRAADAERQREALEEKYALEKEYLLKEKEEEQKRMYYEEQRKLRLLEEEQKKKQQQIEEEQKLRTLEEERRKKAEAELEQQQKIDLPESNLPDFTISAISLEGTSNVLTIVQENLGAAYEGNAHTYIYFKNIPGNPSIKGGPKWMYSWSTLANKDFKKQHGKSKLQPQALLANDVVKVCIDPNNVVAESNENNNCLTETFTLTDKKEQNQIKNKEKQERERDRGDRLNTNDNGNRNKVKTSDNDQSEDQGSESPGVAPVIPSAAVAPVIPSVPTIVSSPAVPQVASRNMRSAGPNSNVPAASNSNVPAAASPAVAPVIPSAAVAPVIPSAPNIVSSPAVPQVASRNMRSAGPNSNVPAASNSNVPAAVNPAVNPVSLEEDESPHFHWAHTNSQVYIGRGYLRYPSTQERNLPSSAMQNIDLMCGSGQGIADIYTKSVTRAGKPNIEGVAIACVPLGGDHFSGTDVTIKKWPSSLSLSWNPSVQEDKVLSKIQMYITESSNTIQFVKKLKKTRATFSGYDLTSPDFNEQLGNAESVTTTIEPDATDESPIGCVPGDGYASIGITVRTTVRPTVDANRKILRNLDIHCQQYDIQMDYS